MPNQKRPRTEKQLANDARLKAAAAARRAVKEDGTTVGTEPLSPEQIDDVAKGDTPTPVDTRPVETSTERFYSQGDYEALAKQVQELKAMFSAQGPSHQQNTPTQSVSQVSGGRIVGVTDKYIVDPAYYPDFTKRLSEEERLARFAFPINYELTYEFNTSQYETKEGLNMKEPMFKLELLRKQTDPQGNATAGRYLISSATFFEDPQSALVVARQNGLEVDENNYRHFLDEMRYIQMRDWLFENFYPPETFEKKSNRREEVIGGKLVTYFEVSSQNSERMPFDQMDRKF